MMGASGMVSFPDRPKRYWIPSPIQRRVGFLPRRKALYMLPVCKCFTSPTETIRTHGCSLCTSPINKKTARHFAEYGDEIIQVFLVVCVCVCVCVVFKSLGMQDLENWGLSKMRASLLQTRYDCSHKCAYIANIIHPCMKDILSADEGKEPSTDLPLKELTQNKASCCTTLKRLLYTPSLSARALSVARTLSARLQQAGHSEAARLFWLYVAPPVPHLE